MSRHIDLSDIYDDCYDSYKDFSSRIELSSVNRIWKNEQVAFSKDETLGWSFRTQDGRYNYGYDTLEDAVTKFLIRKCGEQAVCPEFCASRLLSTSYKRTFGKIVCEVSCRHFKGSHQDKLDRTNTALTQAFNKMLEQKEDE